LGRIFLHYRALIPTSESCTRKPIGIHIFRMVVDCLGTNPIIVAVARAEAGLGTDHEGRQLAPSTNHANSAWAIRSCWSEFPSRHDRRRAPAGAAQGAV
jgi:hypothetical protein